MVDTAQEYFWLAADGTRQSGTEQTLRAALSGGALVAATLVWRKGWNEWLPAQRVPELAASIPAPEQPSARPASALATPLASRPAAAPSRVLTATSTRPTSHALRAPPLSTPAKPIPASSSVPARDPATPSSFGSIGRSKRPAAPVNARPSGTPPPPPMRSRSPMPTLSEEHGPASVTATLRPPGAVPPPARGVPVPAFEASPRPAATMTPIPVFGPPGGKLETPEPAAPEVTTALPAVPEVVNKQLLAEPSAASTTSAAPVAAELAARRTPTDPALTERASQRPNAPHDARSPAAYRDSLVKIGRIGLDSRTVVMVLSGLSGALLVAVIGLWLTRSRKSSTPEAAPSAASPVVSAPAPRAAPGCKLILPAARMAANIERTVPPYASKIANEAAFALGIAASKTKGVGLRVDPNTLDVLPAFEEEGKDAVRGVVPLTRSGALAFFVDRDDRALHSAHTVDEVPPFTLGVNDAGFSRVVAGSASLVWPLPADTKITEPRSAPLGASGYGVTFRRGGQSGAILVGFVGSDGAQKSDLVEVPDAPKFLGTPMIAGSASGALVAFAGRDSPEAAWKLYVSKVQLGAAPSSARALLAGDGGSVISPTLAALPEERWLVQWTEGSSGQYHVHVQSFAADLSPLGQSVLVSPKGANAGQGALATFAGGAITWFILTTAGHDELWGATLTCQ